MQALRHRAGEKSGEMGNGHLGTKAMSGTVWLTRVEAAKYLRITVQTFSRRVREGTLPHGLPPNGGKKVWSTDMLDAAMLGEQAAPQDDIMARIDASIEKTN